jgi:enoyl-CoA hydratase/carnithine racemase
MALLELERPADGVALLTLNRPDRRNALSTELREEGCRHLADLAGDGSVRCLVLTGAGTVFSAGFDLAEFEAAASDEASVGVCGRRRTSGTGGGSSSRCPPWRR